jgi:hypothetical protein
MKRTLLLAPFAFALIPSLLAQAPNQLPPTPPPIAQASPAQGGPLAVPGQPQQRVYGPTSDTLIARQTADGIIEGFRKTYKTDGAPRVIVYVNRALVDTGSGMRLTGHTENYEKTETSTKTSGTNTYHLKEGATATLADQQTVREIERLFGRVFRHAGAQLADQKTAVALLPEQPGQHIIDQSAKDRQALANVADIAIEVLISSRSVVVPEVSGDATYPVPDIQATAIRLKDSAIVGQAAASDVIGRGGQAGRVVRQFSVQDITEATAIALMEDMLTGRKQ